MQRHITCVFFIHTSKWCNRYVSAKQKPWRQQTLMAHTHTQLLSWHIQKRNLVSRVEKPEASSGIPTITIMLEQYCSTKNNTRRPIAKLIQWAIVQSIMPNNAKNYTRTLNTWSKHIASLPKETQAHSQAEHACRLLCNQQEHGQPNSQSKPNVYTKGSNPWAHTDRQTESERHYN